MSDGQLEKPLTADDLARQAAAQTELPKAGEAGGPIRSDSTRHLKKVAIPLLIVTAAMLWLLGGAIIVMTVAGVIRENPDAPGWMEGPVRMVLVLAAFPLGALLLLGAWLFHRRGNNG